MRLHSKEDFQRLALEVLNPLKPYYSEGKAALDLGVTSTNYDEKAIRIEAFSRPLWGLVPFWAGGGREPEFEEIYRRGLTHGTDPAHPEYWGGFHAFDQKFVEMAAMAYGLVLAPEVLWEPLSGKEKENLAAWLYGINEYELPVCNWVLFAVMVNVALKKAGMPYDGEKLQRYLDGADRFYLGEGWYRDGDSNQKDYYISFAIHFYSLFYASVMGEEDPERSRVYRERATAFARQFIYWFDDGGAALPFGRSLTYRFAQVSFFGICLQAGLEPFPVEVMKGLIARHLSYWMSLPIFDRDHILTIGYAYPCLHMAERYNGPGSPYWAMKAFAFLALPDSHPFWSAEAAPFPDMPDTCAMKYADMLVRRYPGHVTAYTPGVFSPSGHGHSVEKYGKFAYDTRFGFSVAHSEYGMEEAAPDSMLAFVIDGYVYVRRICLESKVREDGVYSKWSPYPGVTVETTVTPTENGHKRRHIIESAVSCEAYDCGFAVANNLSDSPEERAKGPAAEVRNRECRCLVRAGMGEGVILVADPNTNVIHSRTLLPAVKYRIPAGRTVAEAEVTAQINQVSGPV